MNQRKAETMTTALNLANYIITKCINDNTPVTNIELQTILYSIQEQHIKKYNKPIFNDNIEAWKFGPCIPDIYYAFCHFGTMPIIIKPRAKINLDKDLDLINSTISTVINADFYELLTEIHRENSPWDKIFRSNLKNIPTNLLEQR